MSLSNSELIWIHMGKDCSREEAYVGIALRITGDGGPQKLCYGCHRAVGYRGFGPGQLTVLPVPGTRLY